MLQTEDSALILVDIQGKLARLMVEKENLYRNLKILINGAKILGIPMIWVEQTPEKLGPTIPEIANLLPGMMPIKKNSFSCCGCERFQTELEGLKRRQAIIAGIEAHVCVCQTALQLLEQGYPVHVVADGISSRTHRNRDIAIGRMRQSGAAIVSTEMVLFELLQSDDHPGFREVIGLVK